MKSLALVGMALLSIGSLSAQENKKLTYDFGGGFATPPGSTGRSVDTGWTIQGGAGVNITPRFTVKADLSYTSLGFTSSALSNFGVPDGTTRIFTATLDPVVHLNPKGHIDFYVTGGGGIFHLYHDLSQPVPAAPYTGLYSVNRPGFDAGAGMAIGTKFHGKVFAEAKFDRMFIDNYHVDFIPVTFGFRW